MTNTNEKKMKAQEARKKYDAENMGTLTTKLRKEDVEAFRKAADEKGVTVSKALADYVRSVANDKVRETNPTGTNVAVLTYENVDRLKHEVAFYNPEHLNPDEMLNYILNRYFAFLKEVRTKSR